MSQTTLDIMISMSKIDSRNTADPNQASPATPKVPRKKCLACCAMYPLSSFTVTKYAKDGYSPQCKECNNQYVRVTRRRKYDTKPSEKHDDHIIRSVKIHNKTLISLAFTAKYARLYALNTIDYSVFIVDFAISERLSLPGMSILNLDGSFICEFSYMATEAHQDTLLHILKTKNLRLERSMDDIQLSKMTIYYI